MAASSRFGTIAIVTLLSLAALGTVWGLVTSLLPHSEEPSNLPLVIGAAPLKPPPQPEILARVDQSERPPAEANLPPVVLRQAPRPQESKGSDRTIPDTGRTQLGLELKCDAEVDLYCPDGEGADRRACVQEKMRQFSASCQQVLRERIMRVKEALLQLRAVCEADARQYCRQVAPGGGALIQCLEDHAQEVSEPCFRLLPKRGRLLN